MAESFEFASGSDYNEERLKRSIALREEVEKNRAKHPEGSSAYEELGETLESIDREIEFLGGRAKLGGHALYQAAVA